MLNKTQRC